MKGEPFPRKIVSLTTKHEKTMKKSIYITFLFATISLMASAQIRIGNYTFRDGGEYVGELKARKPHGKGRTTYANGDFYDG